MVITGANGAGKTHLARRLAALRPDVELVHADALKLTRNWQRRPKAESEAVLLARVQAACWIVEGGPGLLPMALPRAQMVIWLDLPRRDRARRLFLRPLRHLGRTRPELPAGNRDWPGQQWRFALARLRSDGWFRDRIGEALAQAPAKIIWRCRSDDDVKRAILAWSR